MGYDAMPSFADTILLACCRMLQARLDVQLGHRHRHRCLASVLLLAARLSCRHRLMELARQGLPHPHRLQLAFHCHPGRRHHLGHR